MEIELVATSAVATYRRGVGRLGTNDVFSLRFFSKPCEPTELQNHELKQILISL